MDLHGIRMICGGISLTEVSRATGVSRTTLYKIESGSRVRTSKSVDLLHKMLKHEAFAAARSVVYEEISSYVVSSGTFLTSSQVLATLERIETDLALLVQEFEQKEGIPGDAGSITEHERKNLREVISRLAGLGQRIS